MHNFNVFNSHLLFRIHEKDVGSFFLPNISFSFFKSILKNVQCVFFFVKICLSVLLKCNYVKLLFSVIFC